MPRQRNLHKWGAEVEFGYLCGRTTHHLFMSHPAQRKFCRHVRKLFPQHFSRVSVVDIGSLDINGNVRRMFSRSNYIGIDVFDGENVDVVGCAHEVLPEVHEEIRRCIEGHYRGWCEISLPCIDTIVSCEALEHDKHFRQTLAAMYNHLRIGGLMLITCAGDGRAEHGTSEHRPCDSPGTNDYYKNVSNEMFAEILPPKLVKTYHLRQIDGDLQFYGIKKNPTP
jgi:hypothetical protein